MYSGMTVVYGLLYKLGIPKIELRKWLSVLSYQRSIATEISRKMGTEPFVGCPHFLIRDNTLARHCEKRSDEAISMRSLHICPR